MNPQQFIDISMSVIYSTTELALPLLLTALTVGLVVSIFQAATQINEATLSFLPKFAAMIGIFILISPWMVRKITDYTTRIYSKIPEISRER